MSVLLAVPTRREAAALLGYKVVCGTGSAAGDAVAARLDRDSVDLVAIVGVCGGLDPTLGAGDLILATRVHAVHGPELAPSAAVVDVLQRCLRAAGRRFASAPLVSVETPVGSRDEKRDLWNTLGAAGADMETYAIARAVEAHGLPWFALRAVVDPADTTLPSPLRSWRGEREERALVSMLIRRPQDWPALARVAAGMRGALDSLARSVPIAVAAASSALPELEAARANGYGAVLPRSAKKRRNS